jgi:hypothetical protein
VLHPYLPFLFGCCVTGELPRPRRRIVPDTLPGDSSDNSSKSAAAVPAAGHKTHSNYSGKIAAAADDFMALLQGCSNSSVEVAANRQKLQDVCNFLQRMLGAGS